MSDAHKIAEWLRGHGLDAKSMHPTEYELVAHHHVALGIILPLYESAQRDKQRIAELEDQVEHDNQRMANLAIEKFRLLTSLAVCKSMLWEIITLPDDYVLTDVHKTNIRSFLKGETT